MLLFFFFATSSFAQSSSILHRLFHFFFFCITSIKNQPGFAQYDLTSCVNHFVESAPTSNNAQSLSIFTLDSLHGIVLPTGYQAGDDLSGTAFFHGKTLADLGFVEKTSCFFHFGTEGNGGQFNVGIVWNISAALSGQQEALPPKEELLVVQDYYHRKLQPTGISCQPGIYHEDGHAIGRDCGIIPLEEPDVSKRRGSALPHHSLFADFLISFLMFATPCNVGFTTSFSGND